MDTWHGGTVLHKDTTEPLQEYEKLSQGNVPIAGRLNHVNLKCLKLSLNLREKVGHDICTRFCEGAWVRRHKVVCLSCKQLMGLENVGRMLGAS